VLALDPGRSAGGVSHHPACLSPDRQVAYCLGLAISVPLVVRRATAQGHLSQSNSLGLPACRSARAFSQGRKIQAHLAGACVSCTAWPQYAFAGRW
jgi:hypothetical protein